MINTQTEELAALYVLDLLDKVGRKDFEAQLSQSDELRILVRELSAGMSDPLKSATGPLRMDLLPQIQKSIGASPSMPKPHPHLPEISDKPVPWAYIWAAAASLFLVMNLALLFIIRGQSTVRDSDVLANSFNRLRSSENSAQTLINKGLASGETLEARISRLRGQLDGREKELQNLLKTRSVLEAENREVRQYNAGWEREYMHLAARVLPFFESKDGLSRFTVIEMVDVQAFDAQQPRRGFADLAGSFLTGEGNIAGAGTPEFVGPIVEGAGSASLEWDSALSLATRSGEDPLPSQATGYSEPIEAETSMGGSTEAAMGFSVWRDDEQKGFLDIYNLPQPSTGREAFLWVRSSELDPYLPVGYLPELENGTGSFFYAVEETKFTPTEILVTAEDTFEPGGEPSGEILLLGP